jgi:hypothetical protein
MNIFTSPQTRPDLSAQEITSVLRKFYGTPEMSVVGDVLGIPREKFQKMEENMSKLPFLESLSDAADYGSMSEGVRSVCHSQVLECLSTYAMDSNFGIEDLAPDTLAVFTALWANCVYEEMNAQITFPRFIPQTSKRLIIGRIPSLLITRIE